MQIAPALKKGSDIIFKILKDYALKDGAVLKVLELSESLHLNCQTDVAKYIFCLMCCFSCSFDCFMYPLLFWKFTYLNTYAVTTKTRMESITVIKNIGTWWLICELLLIISVYSCSECTCLLNCPVSIYTASGRWHFYQLWVHLEKKDFGWL